MAYYIHENLYIEDGKLYLNQTVPKEECELITKGDLKQAVDSLTQQSDAIQQFAGSVVTKAEEEDLRLLEKTVGTKADKSIVDSINQKLSVVKSNIHGDIGINMEPIKGRGSLQIGSPRDNSSPTPDDNSPTKGNISIYSSEKIVCQDIVNFSDERIKTNISDIKQGEAIETLRKINPKKFEYIDKMNRGSSPTFGFIAQEVKEALPYSVNTLNEFIPNIYAPGQLNKNVLSLHQPADIFPQDIIKIICGASSHICQVLSVSSDRRVLVLDHVFDEQFVFVYGKMVHDFLTINHDAIFSLNVCATRDLDRRLAELEKKLEAFETKSQVPDSKLFSTQIKAQPNELNFIQTDRSISDLLDFHVISQVNNYMYKPTQDVYITPNPFGKIVINWRNSEGVAKTYKVTLIFS